MKKKFEKSLFLNKRTVSNLGIDQMNKIRGASVIILSCECSKKSCSIQYCCPPPTGANEDMIIEGQD